MLARGVRMTCCVAGRCPEGWRTGDECEQGELQGNVLEKNHTGCRVEDGWEREQEERDCLGGCERWVWVVAVGVGRSRQLQEMRCTQQDLVITDGWGSVRK